MVDLQDYADLGWVYHSECREALKQFPDNVFDSIVTDPPYALTANKKGGSGQASVNLNTPYGRARIGTGNGPGGFMGQQWDSALPPVETWAEILRVAKPGAHLLAFGGTRTFHRLACDIENAGWEIRDSLALLWVQGQGFPKSLNIQQAINKAERGCPQGAADPESPNHGKFKGGCCEESPNGRGFGAGAGQFMREQGNGRGDDAGPWHGWGTALKPSYEPIVLARKPFDATVAANVLEYGTGGLNIDGCRVATADNLNGGAYSGGERPTSAMGCTGEAGGTSSMLEAGGGRLPPEAFEQPAGRWPANLVLAHSPDCVCVGTRPAKPYVINRFTDGAKPFGGGAGHPFQTEEQPAGTEEVGACVPECPVRQLDTQSGERKSGYMRADTQRSTDGGYHKGFPKDRVGARDTYGDSGGASRFFYCAKANKKERGEGNNHPTLKPIALMRWLCRLVTPPNGVVLDPFAGSGSTGVAAKLEGFRFLGFDAVEKYVEIANARIEKVDEYA